MDVCFDLESQKRTPRCAHGKTASGILHSAFELICCSGVSVDCCAFCGTDLLEIS